jgi:pyruvate/2-oxoglutarate/acetoin dehydrogenase E1 component
MVMLRQTKYRTIMLPKAESRTQLRSLRPLDRETVISSVRKTYAAVGHRAAPLALGVPQS